MQIPVSLPFKNLSNLSLNKIFLSILVLSVILGTAAGYLFAGPAKDKPTTPAALTEKPKTAQQDTRTFRDFAEGTVQKRPEAKGGEYAEGTHLLVRDGAVPVALTSSVIDLSEYEGKKVKVFGETQKAIKEGWLMDVGKVEEK